MNLPVKGDLGKLTARYYQFGATPYNINGWPVENPDKTIFGFRHHGMDLDVPLNTPVYAPEDGVVLFAGDLGSAGNAVQIKGKTGVVRMLHNNRVTVRTGQSVKQGQLVAYSGATGFSRGISHVHFDLAQGPNGGKYVDPRKYIKEIKEDDMTINRGTAIRLLRLRYHISTPTEAQITKLEGRDLDTYLSEWRASSAFKSESALIKTGGSAQSVIDKLYAKVKSAFGK